MGSPGVSYRSGVVSSVPSLQSSCERVYTVVAWFFRELIDRVVGVFRVGSEATEVFVASNALA